MERPQNGVNGNLPQPAYGFVNAYVNAPMQRSGGQNLMGYEVMPQVMPNQYVNSGNYNIQQNVANMRSMSPSMTPPQFVYQYPNIGMYQYPTYQQPYPSIYNYAQEIQAAPTKTVSCPQAARKPIPLIVVDPTSNTDVDLSRYQSTSDKIQTTNILQITEPVSEKKPINKDDNSEKDIICEHDNALKETVEKFEIKIEDNNNINIVKLKETDANDNYVVKKDIDDCSMLPKEELNVEIRMEEIEIEETIVSQEIEKENADVEDIQEEIYDIEKDLKEDQSNVAVEINEIGTYSKSSNDEETIAGSSEEETIPIEISTTKLSYHLPINKKESDETTLKLKLIYDREYLIKFKDIGKSRQWPLNMPSQSEFSEDIISTTPRYISCQLPESSSNQINVDKSINKKQMPNRQFSSGYKKPNRPAERKQINLDISETQVFVRSKSGYLPPQFRDKHSAIDPYVELKRNIKSNLNKITPQNFQDCLAEIEKLNIYDKEEMSCLINEIFIKAVKEEAYSVTYAQFCNKLAYMYVDNQPFKSQLLKKCQDMFETPLKNQLCTVKDDWELKISNETDLKMKALYESDLEEQVKKAKDKYFGNIRFIGELFLHNLLAAKVILNCVVELLNGSDDSDAMLALCKLLETCGKQIDTKHKDQMNKFIIKIHELSLSKELEKRIRFKLRDIVDMRERDWKSRHIQQEKKINPKTLQELKDETAAEVSAASTKFAAMNKKRNMPSNNSRRNVPNVSHRQLSIKKLTCNSHTVDEKTVLGPVGGNWLTWGNLKPKANEIDGWTSVGNSQKLKNTPSRYSSNSRSREQSPQVLFANKYRNLESSAEASGADSRSSTPPLTLPLTKPYRMRTIETEIVISEEDQAQIIFNDLLSTGHFNTNGFMQLRDIKPVIERWIDDMMEKDVNCRRSLGDSFKALLMDKKLTTEQIVDGTRIFVSSIEDLICDIPKLWEFFAQFLERFIHDKNSNISFFESIFKPILPNMNVAHCFSVTLHEASSRLGHNIVGQVFHRSLNWDNIVPDNLDSFIKENGLEFTLYGGAPLSPVGGEPLNYIAEELDDMLSSNSSNENIFDFLEKHIDKPTWKKSEFSKTITTSILKALKRMPDSAIREYLKNKKEIIKRISNHKLDHEMEILISILHVAHELKKDILTLIYDIVITEGIVSNTTLKSYLNNTSLQSEHNFKLTYPIISQLYVVNEDR